MCRVISRSIATPLEPVWRQCHASTLLIAPGGELLCAWFAGTAEGTEDNAIWLARGHRHGDGWTFGEPERMSERVDAHWNPVLGRAPDGGISLFFKVGRPISRWQTLVRRSPDGRIWSPSTELVPGDIGGRGPVKNPPIVAADGTWVAPASVESAEADGRPVVWDSFADISSDSGDTWHRSALIGIDHETFPGAGVIQPTMWVGCDGQIVALLRSTSGFAWRSTSTDGGYSWTAAQPTSLPNNNSGLCAVALPGGTVVCAHNTSGVSWGPRNELVLSGSRDDGVTWERLCVIDRLAGPDEVIQGKDAGVVTTGRSELSYPTVIVDSKHAGRVLVSYTRERRSIVVAALEV